MTTPRSASGYVLLSILLVAVLIASLVMTYSRHALLAVDNAQASAATQQAMDATDSGFAWAKHSLLDDKGSTGKLDLGDGRSVSVDVATRSGDLRTVTVDGQSVGGHQALAATFQVYPTTGAALPVLIDSAKVAVATASGRIFVSGAASYTSTDLTGVIVMENGSSLVLQDVVLDGVIVSRAALGSDTSTVRINLKGGVLIQPGSVLPGCAIVAPNAIIAGDGSERVQFGGAVVAQSLSLPGTGVLHGAVAARSAPSLGSGFDRPGFGRAPLAWPSCLDTGSAGVGRLSFAPVDVPASQTNAIKGFSFPARGGGQAQGGQGPGP